MSTLAAVHAAQHDVAQVQSALASVQTGLDSVEAAAETVREARRGLRRVVKLGLLVGVIAVIAIVVASKRRNAEREQS